MGDLERKHIERKHSTWVCVSSLYVLYAFSLVRTCVAECLKTNTQRVSFGFQQLQSLIISRVQELNSEQSCKKQKKKCLPCIFFLYLVMRFFNFFFYNQWCLANHYQFTLKSSIVCTSAQSNDSGQVAVPEDWITQAVYQHKLNEPPQDMRGNA